MSLNPDPRRRYNSFFLSRKTFNNTPSIKVSRNFSKTFASFENASFENHEMEQFTFPVDSVFK